ncbi:hypothetical protein AB0C13_32145 [Streptomyces sp. NPDC049099]|uniref:hypothetical protein n=1 Tax=Streptomyces sp. NPDC049099 TaxID=3155768 RepID=UPI003438AD3F
MLLLSHSGDLAVVGTIRHRGHVIFGVPRSTVYGHLAKTDTVPRAAKKTAVAKS